MESSGLTLENYIEATEGIIDTVWEMNLKENKIHVWRDQTFPTTTGQILDLKNTLNELALNNIYHPDLPMWNEIFQLGFLNEFAENEERNKRLEIRFIGEPYGFEWHEVFLNGFRDTDGGGNRILMFARRIESQMRSRLVEVAVQEDYDYVTYIDANTNHHIRYLSSTSAENLLPPEVGDNYEQELEEYNKAYVPEDIREDTTQRMRLDRIMEELEKKDEYILYSRTIQDGNLRDKKLRYSYYNREQKILLLTRTDITEIREEKRQKELLLDALSAAQVANEAKSTFLSRMSHDIRTPMNAIIGLTAIAAAHADDHDRIMDCLKKITQSSKLLLGLINEVLDMSKIESGKIVLSEEDFHLSALFEDIIAMVIPDLDRRGHKLNVHIEDVRHEAVTGDMQRLQQVVNNLLSNAVKYTPDGGCITLEISEKAVTPTGYGLYQLICEDNGVGMPPEFLNRIFEPFERADDERISMIQGTGLGMSICKNIVQMMDGDITVDSALDQGTRFTVTFKLKIRDMDLPDFSPLTELPVLVADDDLTVCHEVCGCLDEIGMKSSFVTTGTEAVQAVTEAAGESRGYFAAIVDLRMPDMDGIEVTRRIRARVGADMPILVISAYDTAECEAEAKKAGANGFISKPLFPSKLICMLRKFAVREENLRESFLPDLPDMDFSGRRILLVEDNSLNQEIAAEFIRNTGAYVEIAEDGREAVDRFSASCQNYYDLIFMDIQMPRMNGYEAAQAIRALDRPDAGTVPIVAMTANAFTEDIKMALDSGMNQHTAKPIDARQLISILAQWFES